MITLSDKDARALSNEENTDQYVYIEHTSTYEYDCRLIFKHKDTNKFYELVYYHNDYGYVKYQNNCEEVTPVKKTVVITEWVSRFDILK